MIHIWRRFAQESKYWPPMAVVGSRRHGYGRSLQPLHAYKARLDLESNNAVRELIDANSLSHIILSLEMYVHSLF